MKIAITGTTRGYGKAVANMLSIKGHTVVPLNRQDGYDISSKQGRALIYDQAINCDVVINNAWHDFDQETIFSELFDLVGKDTSKTIVNVNSRAGLGHVSGNMYFATKKQLKKKTTHSKFPGPRCRIINVYPGYIATPHILKRNDQEGGVGSIMTLAEAADILVWDLAKPQHIEIAEIAFWAINKSDKTDK